jgi:O-methyltransferase
MLPSIIAAKQLEAIVRLAESAPDGDFAEIGVYRGGSASHLYRVALAQGRQLHLFDTFTGTPFSIDGLDYHKIDDEFADDHAEQRIRALLPSAHLHVGIYPDTHPADLGPLAFIHCDCDQYESYRAVIDKMWPLVVPGGFLLFDDYPYLKGAKKAVEESFDPSDLRRCGQRFYAIKA